MIGGWGSETGLTVPPNREIVFRVRDVIATRSCVSARRDSGVARAGGTQKSCSSSCPPVCPGASRCPGRVRVRPDCVRILNSDEFPSIEFPANSGKIPTHFEQNMYVRIHEQILQNVCKINQNGVLKR